MRVSRGFWVFVAGASGCGPGLEMQHENNLRFEHCYRLDADPKISASHRGHCWKEWTARFAADQPLDRIEYARRRIADLDSGNAAPVTIHSRRDPEGRVFEDLSTTADGPIAAPTPTSAHAPPPRIQPVAEAPRVDAAADSRPGGACAATCNGDLSNCNALCVTKHADCGACREDYRRCMRRCFE